MRAWPRLSVLSVRPQGVSVPSVFNPSVPSVRAAGRFRAPRVLPLMVSEAGLEPARGLPLEILSLLNWGCFHGVLSRGNVCEFHL